MISDNKQELKEIKNKIELLVDGYSNVSIIDDIEIYGDKKLAATLSKEKHMASIEVLPDYTLDFLIIEIESEKLITTLTKQSNSMSDLVEVIKENIEIFSCYA